MLQLRADVLASYHASDSEISELLEYNQNVFAQTSLGSSFTLPMPPEAYIPSWQQYLLEAETMGVYGSLKSRLVQFQFPILKSISETEAYRAATRKGELVDHRAIASGLSFRDPEKLQLRIHPTLAGPIPVIIAGNREDFVILVQALTKRNEPQLIPESMGACIVSGYNNWDRVRQYRQQWSAKNPDRCSEADWNREFKSLIPHKELYQDRFIILSPGLYSNIPSDQLGLPEQEWQQLSLTIRLEHECTHYLTRRLFGSMRNNLLDELIADYRGIVAAIEHYRANWFLNFLGLESFPVYRKGGRLENYRGEPPLSEGAFKILQELVKKAAENLEDFDNIYFKQPRTLKEDISILSALTTLTLEELASNSAEAILKEAVNRQQESLQLSEEWSATEDPLSSKKSKGE